LSTAAIIIYFLFSFFQNRFISFENFSVSRMLTNVGAAATAAAHMVVALTVAAQAMVVAVEIILEIT
jgi:hypothetical protein